MAREREPLFGVGWVVTRFGGVENFVVAAAERAGQVRRGAEGFQKVDDVGHGVAVSTSAGLLGIRARQGVRRVWPSGRRHHSFGAAWHVGHTASMRASAYACGMGVGAQRR